MIEKELFIYSKENEFLDLMKDKLHFEKEIVEYYANFEEKLRKPDLLGKTLKVARNQFENIYNIVQEIAGLLEMHMPDVYVYEDFYYGIESKGIETPWIEISAKTILDFSEKELRFLIARELWNIKSKNTYYSIVISEMIKKIGGSGFPISDSSAKVMKLFTYKWHRVMNYTADNFGYIMCKDLKASINSILKLILNNKYLVNDVNISNYIEQAESINELEDDVYNYTKMDELIPYGPFRIKNILAYASSIRGLEAMKLIK